MEKQRLREEIRKIRGYALDYGLDFFEVIFEVVNSEELNQVAAYGGFPTRYPHWRFGMEYEQLKKSYTYGLSKIYELVINNDPSYAYLVNTNSDVEMKLVIAHVYGHSDFFKCNQWFSKTNRKMLDEMANHSTKIRRFIEQIGEDVVESFIDVCLSLENLIDPYSVFISSHQVEHEEVENEDDELSEQSDLKIKSKSYMDKYINPPEFLKQQREKIEKEDEQRRNFPESPERDILKFLIEYAPLESWQRTILSIIREEAYYFVPQAQTKIMNEGWASYWHSTLMTEKILSTSEVIDYADRHSATMGMQPGNLNPYKIGLEIFRDIEDRWNKGKFGKEYNECKDLLALAKWDHQLGLGREKIFEVRKVYNDVSFIDEFLTLEFCERANLFTYRYDTDKKRNVVDSRDFETIKTKLLKQLTNFGQPFIQVIDANYLNRGELFLQHMHDGNDIDLVKAADTLKNVFYIWQRPIHISTQIEGTEKVYSYNGEEVQERTLG